MTWQTMISSEKEHESKTAYEREMRRKYDIIVLSNHITQGFIIFYVVLQSG